MKKNDLLPLLNVGDDEAFKAQLDEESRRTAIRHAPKRRRAKRLAGGQLGTVRARGRWWRLQYRGEPNAEGLRPQLSRGIGLREEMDYEAARAYATRLMEQLAPRSVAPGSTCLWEDWCQQFVEIYLPNRRRRSRRTIGSIIRAHVRPAFAGLQIHEIRVARVQGWIAKMRARGAAAETIAGRYRVLRQMLRRARAAGLAVEVPTASDIDLPSAGKARGPARPLTTEELQRILAATTEPWRTLFALLAYCGLRISEALGLRWLDLDLETRRLRIVRQAGGADESGDAAPKTRSSCAERAIPPRLAEKLRVLKAGHEPDEQGFVFPSPRGGSYDDTGVRRHHLVPLLEQLGIEGVTSHSFRRWFGTQAERTGASLPTLSGMLRHSSWRATQRYVHVDTAEIDRAIERIEKSVNGDDEAESVPNETSSDTPDSA